MRQSLTCIRVLQRHGGHPGDRLATKPEPTATAPWPVDPRPISALPIPAAREGPVAAAPAHAGHARGQPLRGPGDRTAPAPGLPARGGGSCAHRRPAPDASPTWPLPRAGHPLPALLSPAHRPVAVVATLHGRLRSRRSGLDGWCRGSCGMREAVGGLMEQGAEHVDRAALEAFAADQDLRPVTAGGDQDNRLGTSGWWLRMAVQACSRVATRRLTAVRSTGAAVTGWPRD
jgi:hypothetical protein